MKKYHIYRNLYYVKNILNANVYDYIYQ